MTTHQLIFFLLSLAAGLAEVVAAFGITRAAPVLIRMAAAGTPGIRSGPRRRAWFKVAADVIVGFGLGVCLGVLPPVAVGLPMGLVFGAALAFICLMYSYPGDDWYEAALARRARRSSKAR